MSPASTPRARSSTRWGASFALASCLLAGCQVTAPPHSFAGVVGVVRAEDRDQARATAELLDELEPKLLALLPDSRSPTLEVWIQESPALYRLSPSAYNDADGFWAEEPQRIHLRRHADNLERTLAHELVHASIGTSWRKLPGTLEEGLCDVVSAELCPQGAARMRAGRLSSASFATGGLVLELDIVVPAQLHPLGLRMSFLARMRLEGDPPEEVDPLDVFDVHAGLSSTSMPADRKKAFYGLSYLVIERIVERSGFGGLHALCERAAARGRAEVPVAWLLEAAGLDADPTSWRAAIVEALGPRELEELVRMHPEFLVETLVEFFHPYLDLATIEDSLPWLDARLSVGGGEASVSLLGIPEVRERLLRACASASAPTLARR